MDIIQTLVVVKLSIANERRNIRNLVSIDKI